MRANDGLQKRSFMRDRKAQLHEGTAKAQLLEGTAKAQLLEGTAKASCMKEHQKRS
jgi:hypothetical protein